MTVIGPLLTGILTPDDSRISYSGFAGVSVTSSRLRSIRPVSFSNGLEYNAPGAKVKLRTNSADVSFVLTNNSLMNNTTITNSVFSVYINEVWYQDYTPASSGLYTISLNFGNNQLRKIELVFPHAAGYDLISVSYDPILVLLPFLQKKKILVVGDSITQGAFATSERFTWPYLLGQIEDAEIINMGYSGSVIANLGNGNWSASMQPDVIVFQGHNDYNLQTAIATYKNSCTSMINAWLSNTTAKIYAVTTLWTNVSRTIPVSSYRTALSEVVTAIANSRVSIVDGTTLSENSTSHFPDGVHPNDAGSAAIALNLSNVITF